MITLSFDKCATVLFRILMLNNNKRSEHSVSEMHPSNKLRCKTEFGFELILCLKFRHFIHFASFLTLMRSQAIPKTLKLLGVLTFWT